MNSDNQNPPVSR